MLLPVVAAKSLTMRVLNLDDAGRARNRTIRITTTGLLQVPFAQSNMESSTSTK
jgi:hypothetical protein